MGFRECVAEVIRYLERIEGLDIQNPLRLRLTSHLQCCAAQRELASKQATAASSPWTYGTTQPYPPLNPLTTAPTNHQPPITNISSHQPTPTHHQNIHDMGQFDITTSCVQTPVSTDASTRLAQSSTSTMLTPLTTTTSTALGYSPHQYPVNTFSIPTTSHHQNYNQNNPTSQGMKPYRPWGAEVAY